MDLHVTQQQEQRSDSTISSTLPAQMSANKKQSQSSLKKSESTNSRSSKSQYIEKPARFRKDTDFGFSIVGARPIAISKVRPDGPAARAGIAVGDFLLKVNGKRVTETEHEVVVKVIQSCTEIDLVVLRRKNANEPSSLITSVANTGTGTGTGTGTAAASSTVSVAQPLTSDAPTSKAECEGNACVSVPCEQPQTDADEQSQQPALPDCNTTASDATDRRQFTLDVCDAPTVDSDVESAVERLPSLDRQRSSVSLDNHTDSRNDSQALNDAERDTVSLCDDALMKLSTAAQKGDAAASSSRLTASIRPRAFSVRKPAASPSEASPDRLRSHSIRHRARSSQPSITANLPSQYDDATNAPVLNASSSDERRSSDGGSRASLTANDTLPTAASDAAPELKRKQLSAADVKRLLAFSNEANDELNTIDTGDAMRPPPPADELPTIRPPIATPPTLVTSPTILPSTNDCTTFEDCAKCLRYPAQLAIYLNYLWRNAQTELNPLLFTLVADNYQTSCAQAPSSKEVRKWAYEIFAAFVTEHSPLSIAAQLNADAYNSAVEKLEMTLNIRFDKEEWMKNAFCELRNLAADRCTEVIREFSHKVVTSGLGPMYGTHQLVATMTPDAERALLEATVNGLLEQLVASYKPDWSASASVSASSTSFSREQNEARGLLIAAVLTVTKHYGLMLQPASVEKCGIFNAKSKRGQFFKRSSSKVFSIRNHQFAPHHFYVRTLCVVCRSILAGVGTQGYLCGVCETTVHVDCARLVSDVCHKIDKAAAERERQAEKKRHSSTTFGILRKPSAPPNMQPHPVAAPGSYRHETWTPGMFISPQEDTNEFADVEAARKHSENDSVSPETRQSSSSRRARSEVDRAALEAALRSAMREAQDSSQMSNSLSSTLADGDTLHNSTSATNVREASDTLPASLSASMTMSTSTIGKWREDPDLDVEVEMKSLDVLVPEVLLKKMKPKEKELQKVLNELLYTERTHLRNMKILLHLFYHNWPKGEMEELRLIMPNLADIVDLHKQFCTELQTARDQNNVIGVEQLSEVLGRWFVGEPLQRWKDVCSTFCQHHSQGIELLRIRRRKDLRFDEFLSTCEAEPLCRRLQIKDFVPMQMQRLTKYPLLVEGSIKQLNALIAQRGSGSVACLDAFKAAVVGMKSVLQTVNDRVRECENQFRWTEIQKRIDRPKFDAMTNDPKYTEYKGFAFSKQRMIYDGPLQWRLNKERRLDCHLVLLDSHLLLLRKEDDRLIVKSHSVTVADSKDDKKQVTPIISLANGLYHVREDAREKRGFLLLADTHLYELCTISAEERRKWVEVIVRQMQQCKAAAAAAKRSAAGEPPLALPGSDVPVPRSVARADSNISLPGVAPVTTDDASALGVPLNNSIMEYEADDADKPTELSGTAAEADADAGTDAASHIDNANANVSIGDTLQSNPEQPDVPDASSSNARQQREGRKRSSSLGDRSAISRLFALSHIEYDDEYEQELTNYLERGRRDQDAPLLPGDTRSSTSDAPRPRSARLTRHESDSCKREQSAGWFRTMSVRARPYRSHRRSIGERQRRAESAERSPSTFSRSSRFGSSKSGSVRPPAAATAVELLSDEAFAALLRRTSTSMSMRRREQQEQQVQVTGEDPEFVDGEATRNYYVSQTDVDRILAEIDAHDLTIRVALSEKRRLVNEYLRIRSQTPLPGEDDVPPPIANSNSMPGCLAESEPPAVMDMNTSGTDVRTAMDQAVGQAQKVLAFLATSETLAAATTSCTPPQGSTVSMDEVYAALPTDTVFQVLGGLNKHLTELLRVLASVPRPAATAPDPADDSQLIASNEDASNMHNAASPNRTRISSHTFEPCTERIEQTVTQNLASPISAAEPILLYADANHIDQPSLTLPSQFEPTIPPLAIDVATFIAAGPDSAAPLDLYTLPTVPPEAAVPSALPEDPDVASATENAISPSASEDPSAVLALPESAVASLTPDDASTAPVDTSIILQDSAVVPGDPAIAPFTLEYPTIVPATPDDPSIASSAPVNPCDTTAALADPAVTSTAPENALVTPAAPTAPLNSSASTVHLDLDTPITLIDSTALSEPPTIPIVNGQACQPQSPCTDTETHLKVDVDYEAPSSSPLQTYTAEC